MASPKKISRIKESIVSSCQNCSGSGCSVCSLKCARVDKYADAGIPVIYWMLSFKNFSGDKNFKEKMKSVVADIDSFYDKGSSMLFVGGLGTGKTYMACAILKLALLNGYTAKYTTMADSISGIISGNDKKYMNELLKSDFLVIDEFDSRWIFPSDKAEKLFGSNLEHIVRNRFQNKLPTILCSNTKDIDMVLSGDFSKSFKSLRSKYLEVLYVGGRDYRRIKDGN